MHGRAMSPPVSDCPAGSPETPLLRSLDMGFWQATDAAVRWTGSCSHEPEARRLMERLLAWPRQTAAAEAWAGPAWCAYNE